MKGIDKEILTDEKGVDILNIPFADTSLTIHAPDFVQKEVLIKERPFMPTIFCRKIVLPWRKNS